MVKCRVFYSRDVLFDESEPTKEVGKEEYSKPSLGTQCETTSAPDQESESGEKITDEDVSEKEKESLPSRRSSRISRKPDYYGE